MAAKTPSIKKLPDVAPVAETSTKIRKKKKNPYNSPNVESSASSIKSSRQGDY